MMFVYPAWVFLFYAPLALLPLKWAVSVWTGVLLAGSLDFIGYLAYRWGSGQPSRMTLWTLLLAIGSLPFLAISVTKGQMGLASLAGLAAALWLWKRRPLLAGAALGVAFFKPTVAVIPILGFLLWALIERRPRILMGFLICLGILALASFIAIGYWLPDYLALLATTGGAPVLWSLAFIPWPWKAIYALLFMALGGFALAASLRRRDRSPWLSASILAGIALFPMRWIYDLLFGILIALEEKDVRSFKAISLALALIAPWLFAILPRDIRWQAEVIGMPLIWAIAWWTFFVGRGRVVLT
jgi:glucan phosphoethanolaminetransferase (alkaline phosphatase superfamily)